MADAIVRSESPTEFFRELVETAMQNQRVSAHELTSFYVVNLLTGFRKELIPTFATHTHLRAISAVANAEERKTLRLGAADSVKRVRITEQAAGKSASSDGETWFEDSAQSLYAIRDFLEFKTTWHPIGA